MESKLCMTLLKNSTDVSQPVGHWVASTGEVQNKETSAHQEGHKNCKVRGEMASVAGVSSLVDNLCSTRNEND